MLIIRNLTKQHGSKLLLKDVSIALRPGEVLGLAERVGSGVGTLLDVLAGRDYPDSGSISLDGRRLEWPFRPHDLRIGIIYEEPKLVESLDIPGNIFLGNEQSLTGPASWFRIVSPYKAHDEAARLLDALNLYFPSLTAKPSSLSTEQKQLVAIARVAAGFPRLIIIENPGRSLSLPYQEQLLQLMKMWQERGCMIILCSTNLDHLFAAADRIAVLRDGRLISDTPTDRTSREEIVAAVVGTADHQQITPVIWALDSFYQARKKAEMLHYNQQMLKRDLAKQDSLNKQLLKQLSLQVEALDKANVALQDAQRRLLTEREQERKHLARELHDQLIQDLLSLSYELEDLENTVEAPPKVTARIPGMREHIRRMIDDLRRICGNLRPPTIDSLGLDGALKSYVANWSEQTGIAVELNLDPNVGRLPEKIELSIFRIVQEGLSNIRKHANASHVVVSVTRTSPRMLKMTITDNGEGLHEDFDLGGLGRMGHFGLLGVTERVALMGGRIDLGNQPGGGLQIQVEIPHSRRKPAGVASLGAGH
ncbi:MAG: ATP-binding cassette domain-containing protein [Anaerolineales bacterium]|nr:ATP-binding cassette domain-containing protein [Anaerolineales bacterium]